MELEDPMRIVCREGELDKLLGDLAVHRLDLVISDHPVPAGMNVKAYTHSLGETGISFFAHKRIARKYQKHFPASMEGAPLLMPVPDSPLRRSLDDWFDRTDIAPRVVAEFDDSALLKAFGEAALGIFPAPTAIADEVISMYHAVHLGTADDTSESYYAISPERKLKHPAVLAVTEAAREELFA